MVYVHVDPSTLQARPWIGALIGLAGVVFFFWMSSVFWAEYGVLNRQREPDRLTLAEATAVVPRSHRWVTLTDGLTQCELAQRSLRNVPERWLFGRVARNQTSQQPKVSLDLIGKLVFGSDNPDDTMEFYRSFMAALEIPEAVQEKVYHGNATEWLGLS